MTKRGLDDEDNIDAAFDEASRKLKKYEKKLDRAKQAKKENKDDPKLAERYSQLKEKLEIIRKEYARTKWEKEKPRKQDDVSVNNNKKKTKWMQKREEKSQNQAQNIVEDENVASEQTEAIANTTEGWSIFVGNLSTKIDEDTVYATFKDCGEKGYDSIVGVRFGYDDKGEFKRYAHVDFDSAACVEEALKLNGTKILGKAIRIEPAAGPKVSLVQVDMSKVKPAENKDRVARCFVGNLSFEIDETKLICAFEELGCTVSHVMWVTDKVSGNFYGTSFVTFETDEDASLAVGASLAGLKILGRPARVEYSPHRKAKQAAVKMKQVVREQTPRPEGGTNKAFFGNLSYNIDDDTLIEFCKDCGEVINIRWLENQETGAFRGSAYADMDSVEAVDKLVSSKNGEMLLGRPVRVDYA